jgi:predicted transcriptional regulator
MKLRGRSELKLIVDCRRMLGLTQQAISEQAKISPNRLAFAETGRLDLRPDEIERIRKVIKRRAQRVISEVLA